ncbi:MAG: DUF1194 domain-containing protein, partial [Halocynthiibacter sp.]
MRRDIPRLLIFVLLVALFPGRAAAACRQALALGLDVSGSVNAREYRLQLDGLANALRSPDVRAALLAMPEAPVALSVFEWSGPGHRKQILPWTSIDGESVLMAISETLSATQRQPAEASTAVGLAMQYGADLLSNRAGCWKLTLDLSGDGKSNSGPRPRDVSGDRRFDRVTVNALVVGTDAPIAADGRQSEIAVLS